MVHRHVVHDLAIDPVRAGTFVATPVPDNRPTSGDPSTAAGR
jgi:hypothetical protein